MSSSLRNGSTERDMRSASAQPGRIGSGVRQRARSSDASTDLVVGRSAAAGMLRVATSIIQVGSARSTVPYVEHDPYVERGGVDQQPLTRPRRGDGPERAVGLLGQRSPRRRRPERVAARGQPLDKPVEGRAGGHDRARVETVVGGEDLADTSPQATDSPGGAVGLLGNRPTDGVNDTRVDAAARAASGPAVDQARESLAFISPAHPLERAQRHRQLSGAEFGDLGDLPLPQAGRRGAVGGAWARAARRVRGDAAQDLSDVRFPSTRAVQGLGRQRRELAPARDAKRSRSQP